MFGWNRKKRESVISLVAPVSGEMLPLNQVPDKVFASGALGIGCAFRFDGDTVAAPCDGTLILLPDSKHAFGIRATNGAEILVHIGLDTVSLKGEGFTAMLPVGSKIHAGETVLKVNQAFIKGRGFDLATPLVVTNSADYSVEIQSREAVELGTDKIGTVAPLKG